MRKLLMDRKVLLGTCLLLLIAAAAACGYIGSPSYTAGKGQGSATGDTAMESIEGLYGESRVEKLAELSKIPAGENPANYLLENSTFLLDAGCVEARVDMDRLSMEANAQKEGCTYVDYVTGPCGYESVDAYEIEIKGRYERFAKERLAVYEAARKKHITVSTEEYKKLLPEYAEKFGYGEDVERFEEECDKDSIANEMLYDKTIESLRA